MTASGTYNFNLSVANLLLESFDRVGIRPSEITREQIKSGIRSVNLELQSMSLYGVNLWAVELEDTLLVDGTATYNVPTDTIDILDAYIETSQDSQTIDRVITPISRTDYADIPNKEQEGTPTVYWFDKLITPTITLWNVPDDNGPYTLFYYRVRRIQDAAASMGQTPEIPYLFLEALCAGVAARLAQKYVPTIFPQMKADAKERLSEALAQNREMTDMYIAPNLTPYWII